MERSCSSHALLTCAPQIQRAEAAATRSGTELIYEDSGMCATPNHRLTLRVVVCLAVGVLGIPSQVKAQERAVPKTDYFLSFRFFQDGNYGSAMRAFRSAARSGIRSSEGRWVDSICYHTMIGECYYHMGDLTNALDQYDAALKLFVRYNNWLLRINFPPALTASNRVVTPRVTLGAPKRQFALARIPDTMSSLQGAVNNLPAIARGGVVAPPQLFPLRVPEIVRCTTLAIRRRTEIMGPTSPHSALTKQLLGVLSTRPAPPNHWSQAWIDTQLGLAYAAAGKTPEATRELQRSLIAAGQYNHTLSATALVELGKIAFKKNQFDQAAGYFYEATFPAAAFSQHNLVEEAFRNAGFGSKRIPQHSTIFFYARHDGHTLGTA